MLSLAARDHRSGAPQNGQVLRKVRFRDLQDPAEFCYAPLPLAQQIKYMNPRGTGKRLAHLRLPFINVDYRSSHKLIKYQIGLGPLFPAPAKTQADRVIVHAKPGITAAGGGRNRVHAGDCILKCVEISQTYLFTTVQIKGCAGACVALNNSGPTRQNN